MELYKKCRPNQCRCTLPLSPVRPCVFLVVCSNLCHSAWVSSIGVLNCAAWMWEMAGKQRGRQAGRQPTAHTVLQCACYSLPVNVISLKIHLLALNFLALCFLFAWFICDRLPKAPEWLTKTLWRRPPPPSQLLIFKWCGSFRMMGVVFFVWFGFLVSDAFERTIGTL